MIENEKLKGEIPDDWFNDDFFKDENVNEPNPKRDETTYLKFYQIPKTIKMWNPAQSIYWAEWRVNELLEKHPEFVSDMKKIENPTVDFDKMQCFIHFDVIHENDGEMFYVYLQGKYYFGQVINRNISGGKSKYIIQLDIATFSIPLGNSGKLKGRVALVRGHLIKKEKNTLHSDSCENVANNNVDLIKSDVEIDGTPQYFFLSNFDGDKIHKNGCPNVDGSNIFEFDMQEIGTFFGDGKHLQGFSPIKTNKIKSIDLKSHFSDLPRMLKTKYNIDFYNDSRWCANPTTPALTRQLYDDVSKFGSGDTEEKETWKDYQKLRELITSDKTTKWFSIPKLFPTIKPSVLQFFEINVAKILSDIKFDKKNHMMAHYEIEICMGDLMMLAFNPFFVEGNKIYGSRIINEDNVKFNFYYNRARINEFYSIIINSSQGLTTTAYQNFINNKSVSYESGWKSQIAQSGASTGIGLGQAYGFASLAKNTTSAFQGFLLGNVIGAAAGIGFSAISELISRNYQKQDLMAQPNIVKNIPSYETLTKLSLSGFMSYRAFTIDSSSYHSLPGFPNRKSMFVVKNNDATTNQNRDNFIYFNIKKPQFQDEENIILDQRKKGNIIGNEIEIENIFKLTEKDFNFIQGILQPYDFSILKTNELNLLNEILLKGVVILNYSNDWK